jgi:integrase/recombinase XerD
MNRRPSGLSVSKALVGYFNTKAAAGLSPRTLRNYEHRLKHWADFAGDADVTKVSPQDIRSYMAWMRDGYEAKRYNGDRSPLSPKTLRNIYVTLCSFFTWASTEFGLDSPMKRVPSPKYKQTPVIPFTRDEIEALLDACEYTRRADRESHRRFRMRRATARRDRAIILTLLDTGLRASELCALTIGSVDLTTGRTEVRHGQRGGAKGGKGRTVFLGKTVRRFVWRYLAEREDGEDLEAPVFSGRWNRPMNPTSLRQLIKRLAVKAGVRDCYPHRFRHTFAISYLRAGGDVFTLQALLGHSTLDMVRYYARVAEVDLATAHRQASPADNWRL